MSGCFFCRHQLLLSGSDPRHVGYKPLIHYGSLNSSLFVFIKWLICEHFFDIHYKDSDPKLSSLFDRKSSLWHLYGMWCHIGSLYNKSRDRIEVNDPFSYYSAMYMLDDVMIYIAL